MNQSLLLPVIALACSLGVATVAVGEVAPASMGADAAVARANQGSNASGRLTPSSSARLLAGSFVPSATSSANTSRSPAPSASCAQ